LFSIFSKHVTAIAITETLTVNQSLWKSDAMKTFYHFFAAAPKSDQKTPPLLIKG
jgi:hypothetical protein